MFDILTEKLQRTFKTLKGEAKLTENNVDFAMREIRLALLEADVNFKVVKDFIDRVRAKCLGAEVMTALSPAQQVIAFVRDELIATLGDAEARLLFSKNPPSVFLVVGLQGSGKTTSVGKIARWMLKNGHRPLLLSVDVYRPAAREQLQVIAREVDAKIFPGEGIDQPLALAKAALREASLSGYDVLLIDTAGRLQNKAELMNELEKVVRVIKKVDASAPHAVLLVLDATVGQNALSQVEAFHRTAGVTGLVMTKLDGTARGGILVALAEKHKLPVHFIGVGEGIDDLAAFTARDFAQAIAGIES